MHRPSNVDDPAPLGLIAGALKTVAETLPLVFRVHRRTRGTLQRLGPDLGPRIRLLDPQPYMAFLHLWKDAAVVLTDSGGRQEKTIAPRVPCVTRARIPSGRSRSRRGPSWSRARTRRVSSNWRARRWRRCWGGARRGSLAN